MICRAIGTAGVRWYSLMTWFGTVDGGLIGLAAHVKIGDVDLVHRQIIAQRYHPRFGIGGIWLLGKRAYSSWKLS